MMSILKYARALLILVAVAAPGLARAVSIGDAERVALDRDPGLKALREQVNALTEESHAAGELPDPKLKLGLMNLPTDTFDFEQEPMTQLQVGVQQMFPRGSTLKHQRQRVLHLADSQSARIRDREFMVVREVRNEWFETYYWVRASRVLQESERLFEQLVNITRSRYAVGGRDQQDVIRSEFELESLRDRLDKVRANEEQARARLSRWIGPELANSPFPSELQVLGSIPAYEDIKSRIGTHPLIAAERAKAAAGDESVAIAKQAYKPGWMLDITYGVRDGINADGSSRADFLSAMVLIDLPLLPGNRQDRLYAASQHTKAAIMEELDTRILELQRTLDLAHATWDRASKRLERFETLLLSQAEQNAVASLSAYQSDRGDFNTHIRARLSALETRLDALRVRVDKAKAQADLLYLYGEGNER